MLLSFLQKLLLVNYYFLLRSLLGEEKNEQILDLHDRPMWTWCKLLDFRISYFSPNLLFGFLNFRPIIIESLKTMLYNRPIVRKMGADNNCAI